MTPAIRRTIGVSLLFSASVGAQPAATAGSVEGTYKGNDREARLAHVRVIDADPWMDETSYTIVLSEKEPAKGGKPDFDAQFGRLGDALVISVTENGAIFGTQVCHQELEKSGFSSSGTLTVEDFSIAGGKLSARFATAGEQEFFGDRWEIDLRVTGTLPD